MGPPLVGPFSVSCVSFFHDHDEPARASRRPLREASLIGSSRCSAGMGSRSPPAGRGGLIEVSNSRCWPVWPTNGWLEQPCPMPLPRQRRLRVTWTRWGMTRSIFVNFVRTHERKRLLPVELVEEEARLQSEGQAVSGPKQEEPLILISLLQCLNALWICFAAKRSAYGIPDGGEPWDALAEDYEPGCTAKEVDAVFGPLEIRLRELVANLTAADQSPATPSTELFSIGRPKKLLCVVWRRGLAWISIEAGSTLQPTHSVREPTAVMFA